MLAIDVIYYFLVIAIMVMLIKFHKSDESNGRDYADPQVDERQAIPQRRAYDELRPMPAGRPVALVPHGDAGPSSGDRFRPGPS